MAVLQHPSSSFKVFVRWRPLSESESSASEIERSVAQHESNQSISLSSQSSSNKSRTWKSGASFAQIFLPNATNSDVFAGVVAPTFPQVMDGATCNFFAYGHSGSGKTHTIVGYNYEDDQHLGLCLSTARDLFQAVNEINVKMTTRGFNRREDKEELGVAVRLYEVRGKYAYDLFNNGTECHVREGPDGQTHIRGQTEILEGGKVRKETGTSSVHEESSRTHAVLELEVINRALLETRDAVIERESQLVPVGKRATDIYLEEHRKALIRTPEGQFVPNPESPLTQERINTAEAEKREYETRIRAAEDAVAECFKTRRHPCLGGKFVFIDLAGSEYFDRENDTSLVGLKQTPQERQQGRQINTDLFALKEVIRARALDQARIPFRSCPLTMILRSHFLTANKGQSAMILTVSTSESQFAATTNTLKYGNMVGVVGGTTRK